MNKTQLKSAVDTLNDALNDYSLPEYHDRIYNTVYYQLRTEIGWIKKRQYEQANKKFSWNDFKLAFETAFDKPESRTVPLEVLLEYAQAKLGKSLNDLLMDNKINWARRNKQSHDDLDNSY